MMEFKIEWPSASKVIIKPNIFLTTKRELLFNIPNSILNNSYIGCLCDKDNLITGVKVNVYDNNGPLFCIDILNNQHVNDCISTFDNMLT